MPHGEHTKKIQQWLRSRVALVASVLLAAFLFFQLIVIVKKSSETDGDIEALQLERTRLKDEQEQLSKLHTFLGTDYFAEAEARTKLGYQKKGEVAVIITDENKQDQVILDDGQKAVAKTLPASGEVPNVRLWWRYFFGY
ncbi:hypothetical protein HY623_01260 [Candidatus Uhrbacteria bacterium]|nr:hypothetical protein [Candidatus Uhrbacteria bacterium]